MLNANKAFFMHKLYVGKSHYYSLNKFMNNDN